MLRTLFILLLALNFVGLQAQQRLYPVRSGNMWGLMNLQGKLIVPAEYNSIGEYGEEGYAIAQKGNLLGVVDSLGNVTIPCKYQMMDYIGKGLYSIKEDNNWKIINFNVSFPSDCGEKVINRIQIFCTQDIRVQHKYLDLEVNSFQAIKCNWLKPVLRVLGNLVRLQ